MDIVVGFSGLGRCEVTWSSEMIQEPASWIEGAWLLIAFFWVVSALRLKRVVRTEPLAGLVAHSTLLVAASILLFSDWPREAWLAIRVLPRAAWIGWLGAVVAVMGALFTVAARTYLGRNWNLRPSVKEDHEVIRSGPYALVRHPIYTGLLLTATGTALASGLVRGLLALPLILLGLWLKSRAEERLLADALGEPYASYRRAVHWALIPFLL